MGKKKIWSFLLLMLVALTVVLAACSSGDSSEGTSKTDKENEGATEGESASTGNKVLIFGRGGDSVSVSSIPCSSNNGLACSNISA